MPSGDVRTESGHWKPRLTRAALWALLGALSFLLGSYVGGGLILWDPIVSWSPGLFVSYGISFGMLVPGYAYTVLLGVFVSRVGLVRWRRVVGFALLAMPWVVVAFNTGMGVYHIFVSMLDAASNGVVLEYIIAFLIWFIGLFAGGVWVTMAGLVLLPSLRERRSVHWLLAGGTFFAVLAGAVATVFFDAMLEAMPFVFAAWCAVYAAAFSMACPTGGVTACRANRLQLDRQLQHASR